MKRVRVPEDVTQEQINNLNPIRFKSVGDEVVQKRLDIPDWIINASKDSGISLGQLLKFLVSAEVGERKPVGSSKKVNFEDLPRDTRLELLNPTPKEASYAEGLPDWLYDDAKRALAQINEFVPELKSKHDEIIKRLKTEHVPDEDKGYVNSRIAQMSSLVTTYTLKIKPRYPDIKVSDPNTLEECPACGWSVYRLGEWGERIFRCLEPDRSVDGGFRFWCTNCHGHIKKQTPIE